MRLTKYDKHGNLWNKYGLYWSFLPAYLCSNAAVATIHPSFIRCTQDESTTPVKVKQRSLKLTFGADQTAVVADWTEVLEHKNCHRHHGQAHDKHHDPNCRAVGLWRRRRSEGTNIKD